MVLAFATQLPDLVDKPLAWSLGIFASGISVAHSILVGIPVCILVVLGARRTGYPAVGSAYCVGFGSHLLGDILFPLLTGRGVSLGVFLWPVVRGSSTDRPGLLSRVVYYFDEFMVFLATPRGTLYVGLELLLLSSALALWAVDGFPGTGYLPGIRRAGVDSDSG